MIEWIFQWDFPDEFFSGVFKTEDSRGVLRTSLLATSEIVVTSKSVNTGRGSLKLSFCFNGVDSSGPSLLSSKWLYFYIRNHDS